MKKLTKVLALVLVLATLAFTLVSCSTYSNVKKAFEKEGYTESTTLEDAAKKYKEEAEKENLAVTIHAFTKKSGLSSDIVLVYEFNATDDLKKAFNESETIKGFVKDVTSNEDVNAVYDALVNAGYVNGNCFVFSLNPLNMNEVTNIVKKA